MKRCTHLTLAMGTVTLLAMLLVLAVGAQPVARAAGNTIKVPDDFPTIQEAIDAATDGDEIWVASGLYTENLTIDEGIILSGGWEDDFGTRNPGNTGINGNGLGRVISITCPTSDTVVTIDGFTIFGGDASGLGVPELSEIPEISALLDLPFGSETPLAVQTSDRRSTTEQAEQLRAELTDLAAQGLYPGGEPAYQAMLDRLEWVTTIAETAKARDSANAIEQQSQSQQETGSGGGIYSYNASLQLLNNWITGNRASFQGKGLGGGAYVTKAPVGGVRITSNTFATNVAVDYGSGLGGGLYLSQAPGAIIGNNDIDDNIGSAQGDGQGGGIYVFQSPSVSIQDNMLISNLGSNAGFGSIGRGGGLVVDHSSDALVTNNQVERNLANASWYSGSGLGGGLYLLHVDGVVVSDNELHENVATLKANGGGGGMFLAASQNALIADNDVVGNWGTVFQLPASQAHDGASGAGGIGVANVYSATVRGNTIRENTTLVYGAFEASATGGGIVGSDLFENSRLIDNTITGNVACQTDCDTVFGAGGGVYLIGIHGMEVADNTFADNISNLLSGWGNGGGLHLRQVDGDSRVMRNRFLRNRGGMGKGSSGGGLSIDYFPPTEQSVTVDANLFLDNLASSDPSVASSGGAAAITGFDVGEGGFSFTNNVLAGNRASDGGGLILSSIHGGALTNNTLYDNGEIGVVVDFNVPDLTLTNNIVVSHTVGISITEGTTATVRYTLWSDNYTDIDGSGTVSNTHPVTGSPAFVDPSHDDYHLTAGSPAINAGDPAGVPPAPDHDLDGVIRPQGPAVDIGAYEFQGYYQYLPLVAKTPYLRTGWAIGQDESDAAAIVYTADGGRSWQRQGDSATWAGMTGNDISAVDNQTAWAALGGSIDGEGAILHTTDGGATWVSQTIPAGLTGGIKGVKGLSRDEAWAASLWGTVLHTTDGGAVWNVVSHPTVAITQVNRIDAMGSNVWIADASDTGTVVHTSDGGVSWRAEHLPCGDSPLTVHAYNTQAVWASGSLLNYNPSFYRTVNGGDPWYKVKLVGALDHLDDVCAASPDDVWGALNGEESSGHIWRVHVEDDGTPGGLAIAKDVSPPELGGFNAEGVTCLDTRVAWVAAQNERHFPGKPLGIILHTTNGGENWVQGTAPTDIEYWKISFVGARR